MSKKDFEVVSDTLRRVRPDKEFHLLSHSTWALIVLRLADAFREKYPSFDSGKFLHECYEEV